MINAIMFMGLTAGRSMDAPVTSPSIDIAAALSSLKVTISDSRLMEFVGNKDMEPYIKIGNALLGVATAWEQWNENKTLLTAAVDVTEAKVKEIIEALRDRTVEWESTQSLSIAERNLEIEEFCLDVRQALALLTCTISNDQKNPSLSPVNQFFALDDAFSSLEMSFDMLSALTLICFHMFRDERGALNLEKINNTHKTGKIILEKAIEELEGCLKYLRPDENFDTGAPKKLRKD